MKLQGCEYHAKTFLIKVILILFFNALYTLGKTCIPQIVLNGLCTTIVNDTEHAKPTIRHVCAQERLKACIRVFVGHTVVR